MLEKIKRIKFVAIALLIALNALTIGLLTYEKAKKFENPYPLIDFARNYIPQEDFVVNLQPLREELNALVDGEGRGLVSLYFEFLNTGANISINPTLQVWPASLLKLPISLAVMKKIERGDWSADTKLEVLEEDKDTNYGTLWAAPAGTTLTVQELLGKMLTTSDNTAHHVFARNLTFEETVEVMESLGLEDLFTEEGKMSAKEYSRLFRTLYTSSFLTREHSQALLEFLIESVFDEFLASGIPAEVPFSHKFGINSDLHVYLDSGIVYAKNRPYLLTVAVQGNGEEGERDRVKSFMKTVGEKTYVYVTQK